MSDSIRKSLTDILMCIDGIHVHLEGRSDFPSYQQSITVKRAVERDLGIIGEAVNRIIKEDDTFPLSKAKQIIAFRNRVIHLCCMPRSKDSCPDQPAGSKHRV